MVAKRWLDVVVTRAAVIGGNDIEDSLTSDEADSAVSRRLGGVCKFANEVGE
jgi:hypothetical protein